MTDQEMRVNILHAVCNAVKNAGSIVGGIVDICRITKDWAEDSERIHSNAEYLVRKGWIGWVGFGYLIRITVDGVDEYERHHK